MPLQDIPRQWYRLACKLDTNALLASPLALSLIEISWVRPKLTRFVERGVALLVH